MVVMVQTTMIPCIICCIEIHSRLLASNMSQVFVAAFFMILIPVLGYLILRKQEEGTYPPTILPAPTPDPVSVLIAAAVVYPAVEYALGLLAAHSDEVVEYIWSNANSTVVAEFASSMLRALSNSTLEEVLGALNPAGLEAISAVPNSTFASRHLEEEDDFIDYIERWK